MKICILTRSLPVHRTGGLETHTWELARGLVRRGRDVFILTTAHPDGRPSEERGGVKIRYVPHTKPARYTPLFFRRLNREILRLHKRERFDIVHSEGFAGLTFRPPADLPMLATLHGTLFSETPLYGEQFSTYSFGQRMQKVWRYRWRILIRPFYLRFLSRARRIFVDSRFSFNETLDDLPGVRERLRIIPLGIDIERYVPIDRISARKRLGLAPDAVILFTLSRLEEMKGLDVALDAIASLEQQNFIYIIGGEGRLRSALEKQCIRLGLSCVKFVGRIPEEDLAHYFTAADLFIYPEVSQPAFGLVSIESMIYGTPVLASKTGAIPEIVTPDVGWLFERGNSESLAAKLRQLLSDIEELRTRAAALRKYVIQNFSLDTFLDKTLEVYYEVMGRMNAGRRTDGRF